MTFGYRVNPLVTGVETPPIPAVQAWRARYDGRCGPLIDLSQAVPADPPPAALLERLAHSAATPAASQYGPILGDRVLREAHAASVSALYGGTVTGAQVAITSGCNQAFVVTMMALAQAGDAVLLPAPWYFNHKMTLDMLGVEARILPCTAEDAFVPDPAAAQALLADGRVRAIVLVSPNNPTGAIYPPATLAAFFSLARSHAVPLVLDETYRDFLPDGMVRAHELFAARDWDSTLIQLYSFSKAYALPGHRLGAITAHPAFLLEVEKILDSVQICPARTAQAPLAWAIAALSDWRAGQRSANLHRAAACRAAFDRLNGWHLHAIGAYFAFVSHGFAGLNAVAAAQRLALDFGILTLPGSCFGPGQDQHLRIAFANVDAAAMEEVARRLA